MGKRRSSTLLFLRKERIKRTGDSPGDGKLVIRWKLGGISGNVYWGDSTEEKQRHKESRRF